MAAPDNLTPDGARNLAARIRDYWTSLGYDPVLMVAPVVGDTFGRPPHHAIRSDMIGGMPVRRLSGAP